MKKIPIKECHSEEEKLVYPYINVFGSLKEELFIEEFEANEKIISFDKPISSLRFLVEGRAKILLVHENGKQSIVHFLHPGEYLGELTFLDIEKEHKTVIALTQCLFVSVPMRLAVKRLKEEADFLYELNQYIGAKMLKRTYFSSESQNYELKNRLAAYILTTEHNGLYKEKHTETSEYLGVSYRHLLHTLKEFIESGLLVKEKKAYKVNIEGLKELAQDLLPS